MLQMSTIESVPPAMEPPVVRRMAALGEAETAGSVSLGWSVVFVTMAATITGLAWYRSRL
jgi:hypothetical protein